MAYKDTRSLGNSDIAPFKPGESPQKRHGRRKQTNLKFRDELAGWCKDNGWTFQVKNNGHHWIFSKGKTLFECWPSSAKLVRNKDWRRGLHCHDWLKLIEQLKAEDAEQGRVVSL